MSATLALLRSEVRLMLRSPAAMLFSMLLPIAAVIVMTFIPGAREGNPAFGGASVIEAYTAALILFAVTMATLVVFPQTVGSYRELGVLRRLRTTPVTPGHLLGAIAAMVSLIALCASAVIMALPAVLHATDPKRPLALCAVVVLTVLTFLAMGAMLAAVIPGAKVAAGVGNTVAALMWFCAGLWFPRAQFPDWLRVLTDITPGGASARLLGGAVHGGSLPWQAVLVCAVWLVAAAAVAVRTFRWE